MVWTTSSYFNSAAEFTRSGAGAVWANENFTTGPAEPDESDWSQCSHSNQGASHWLAWWDPNCKNEVPGTSSTSKINRIEIVLRASTNEVDAGWSDITHIQFSSSASNIDSMSLTATISSKTMDYNLATWDITEEQAWEFVKGTAEPFKIAATDYVAYSQVTKVYYALCRVDYSVKKVKKLGISGLTSINNVLAYTSVNSVSSVY